MQKFWYLALCKRNVYDKLIKFLLCLIARELYRKELTWGTFEYCFMLWQLLNVNVERKSALVFFLVWKLPGQVHMQWIVANWKKSIKCKSWKIFFNLKDFSENSKRLNCKTDFESFCSQDCKTFRKGQKKRNSTIVGKNKFSFFLCLIHLLISSMKNISRENEKNLLNF